MSKRQKVEVDWISMITAAEEGRFDDIPPNVYARHRATIHRIAADRRMRYQPPSLDWLVHEWIYGPDAAAPIVEGAFRKSIDKWWDRYADEEVVIVEGVEKKHKHLAHEFKQWGDLHPFRCSVRRKDGPCIRPRRVIVVSQWPIDEIWADDAMMQASMHWRFMETYMGPAPSTPLTPTP